MPVVEKHSPGSLCWTELATTDPTAAKSFYGSLFNWAVNDQSMGEGMLYTIYQLQGHDVAGMYGLSAEMRTQGVPPHWMPYFTVSDSDATAAKARELGGKVIAGPFDAHDVGRMAVLEDPTGAKFSLFQPKGHNGAGIVNEIGTPNWPELATRDTAKAESFYTQLLGWGAKKSQMPMEYTEWMLDGQSIGGMMPMDEQWGEAPPHWMVYVMVKSCDETAAKATQLGGSVCVPPTDIPKVAGLPCSATRKAPSFRSFSLAACRSKRRLDQGLFRAESISRKDAKAQRNARESLRLGKAHGVA